MLPGVKVAIFNDLISRLKELEGESDSFAWITEEGSRILKIQSSSQIVHDFLSDARHEFRPCHKGFDFYYLPKGWSFLRIRDVVPFALATAVIDPSGKVRIIVMYDRENHPVPVTIFDPLG